MNIESIVKMTKAVTPKITPIVRSLYPFIACVYMTEVIHFGAKSVFVFGMAGFFVGGALTLLLCVLIGGSYFRIASLSFILAVIVEAHCALSLVTLVTAIISGKLSIPVWLFIVRMTMVPVEAILAFSWMRNHHGGKQ